MRLSWPSIAFALFAWVLMFAENSDYATAQPQDPFQFRWKPNFCLDSKFPMLSFKSKFLFLPDLLNYITLHLPTLKSIRQVAATLKSPSRSFWIATRSILPLILARSLLSSVNNLIKWLTTSGMSLMSITKSSGPNTLPYGTLLITSIQSA